MVYCSFVTSLYSGWRNVENIPTFGYFEDSMKLKG